MGQPYALRALQLDLARQMETLPFIRRCVEFAADHGYNALHLYLEGRVRTASFPYPPKELSYSLDEMRAIVEVAGERGLEVIPQINCLGHAAAILKYPELAHLNELREPGVTGRFGGASGGTFCPSLEATGEFLQRYLAEVGAVFPSGWFGVGLDEVWDMGRCSRCRQRLADGETVDELFAGHINRLHDIVTGLGKRMMMWDDMLEECPAALDQIPADIVQLVWQYGDLTDRTRTHFGHQIRDRRLASFDQRGIDYLVCPADYSPHNGATLTRHAASHRPLGGLMTVWEKSTAFMLAQFPTIAFIGKLWAGGSPWDDAALFKQTAAAFFGVDDAAFLEALWLSQGRPGWGGCHAEGGALRGPVLTSEVRHVAQTRLIAGVLREKLAAMPEGLPRDVLEDLLVELDMVVAGQGFREVVRHAYQRWSGQLAPPLDDLLRWTDAVLAQVVDLRARREAQWQRHRHGLPHLSGKAIGTDWEANVRAFRERLAADEYRCGLLAIRYALADQYGAQKVRWSVRYAGSPAWEKLWEGVPKPRMSLDDDSPFYTFEHPLPAGRVLERLLLETWGHGGIGVCYAEWQAGVQTAVPARIVGHAGLVARPEALLCDDTHWCQLGQEDVRAAMHQPALAEAIHRLEFALGPARLPY